MGLAQLLLIFGSLCAIQIEASYQCGIRKHSLRKLVHHGWKVEEGQWPWHVGLFHKSDSGTSSYACGGTLLDPKHILTAAHCVVNQDTKYPMPAATIELHFEQQNLSKISDRTQIRDVVKIHVHPEHSDHQNDIAVLITRLPVEYTDYVMPICMDQRVDRDLRNLEGQRGWITGWGTTQSGVISDVLRTASMPVVSYLQCVKDERNIFGKTVNENVFCAGDRNGTSPGTGDSGGGMYFSEGDRWVIRGIVSFAKQDELKAEVDTSKYAVFVNVQWFLSWIKEVMNESKPETAKGPKRISERECDRFKGLAKKRANGLCTNSRYPHTVSLYYETLLFLSNGVLINEGHVLTVCTYVVDRESELRVQIDGYGTIGISKVICHPKHRPEYVYHDLAVVKLSTSIHLSSSLIPACLASNWSENLYDTLLKTGIDSFFFTFSANESFHDIKTFIESDDNRVLTNEECDRQYPLEKAPNGTIPGMMCVINRDELRKSISNYVGCPLQSTNSRTCMNMVVGISSHESNNIRERNFTAIDYYSRVAHYLDWIEEIAWNVEPSTKTARNTDGNALEVGSSGTTEKMAINKDFVFPDD